MEKYHLCSLIIYIEIYLWIMSIKYIFQGFPVRFYNIFLVFFILDIISVNEFLKYEKNLFWREMNAILFVTMIFLFWFILNIYSIILFSTKIQGYYILLYNLDIWMRHECYKMCIQLWYKSFLSKKVRFEKKLN